MEISRKELYDQWIHRGSGMQIIQLGSKSKYNISVKSSNVLRTGSLQTKLNAGLSEQQQEDERSFHEVKL